jgi:2-polyprenyl-6-methoxyphenol hydroxylase-like FAD-dependent oxidoreductase
LITFDPENQSNEESLAYIVENDVIQSCLLERLQQLNYRPQLNAKVKRIQSENSAIQIELINNPVPIRTRLLVTNKADEAQLDIYH